MIAAKLFQAKAPAAYPCYRRTPRLMVHQQKIPKRKTVTVELMTDKQAALLRKLAIDAYEPEAFRPNLTKAEAELRITVLKAKLKLMGEPPHTL